MGAILVHRFEVMKGSPNGRHFACVLRKQRYLGCASSLVDGTNVIHSVYQVLYAPATVANVIMQSFQWTSLFGIMS